MVRYADDFVLLCRSEYEAQRALALVQQWTITVGLTLHPEKTRVVDATQGGGFDFLGYHFERGYKWPRKKSLKKFKDTIRGKTKRSNGQSLQMVIANVNRTAKGWFAYFKHSHHYTFKPLDQFMRTRLRSIVRRRSGRRGMSRGGESRHWIKALFAE
jgi:RNA-directed DNA polymerase